MWIEGTQCLILPGEKFQTMGKWDVGTEGECSRMSSSMKEEGDVEFGNR